MFSKVRTTTDIRRRDPISDLVGGDNNLIVEGYAKANHLADHIQGCMMYDDISRTTIDDLEADIF